ncbi:MAG: hypothetical protein LC635_02175 [Pseudonocardiaceae bacterium]|nr:hypothetical protein [Pseudonocardiaceae bacterium]
MNTTPHPLVTLAVRVLAAGPLAMALHRFTSAAPPGSARHRRRGRPRSAGAARGHGETAGGHPALDRRARRADAGVHPAELPGLVIS